MPATPRPAGSPVRAAGLPVNYPNIELSTSNDRDQRRTEDALEIDDEINGEHLARMDRRPASDCARNLRHYDDCARDRDHLRGALSRQFLRVDQNHGGVDSRVVVTLLRTCDAVSCRPHHHPLGTVLDSSNDRLLLPRDTPVVGWDPPGEGVPPRRAYRARPTCSAACLLDTAYPGELFCPHRRFRRSRIEAVAFDTNLPSLMAVVKLASCQPGPRSRTPRDSRAPLRAP